MIHGTILIRSHDIQDEGHWITRKPLTMATWFMMSKNNKRIALSTPIPEGPQGNYKNSKPKKHWETRKGPENLADKRDNALSTFGPHNGYASFSTFGTNFRLSNHRFPRKGRGRISCRIFIIRFHLWRWRGAYSLIYVLQGDITMNAAWFNKVKWVGNWRS